jgi:D-glycero-alpha-D-manno-heptose-7-phosphate kinase
MLVSKTPYRVSLFGGGTDFPEYFKNKKSIIVGGAINKYVYISLNSQVSDITKKKIKIFSKNVELVNNIKLIKHKVIREALKSYKIKKNIELHIASDLPSFTGLGSSSAFSVGLLNLLSSFKKKKLSKKILAAKAINFERNILQETVGYQDQIHSSFGGFNIIKIYKNKFIVKNILNTLNFKKIEKNLILVFTGITRKADSIEKKKIKRFDFNKKYLDRINNISVKAIKFLNLKSHRNLDYIGHLLNQTWQIKKKLNYNVSNKKIDYLYNLAIKNGAIGGKLLGAGSGGFLLFYVKSDKIKKFLIALKKFPIVNFKFTNYGSKIISV